MPGWQIVAHNLFRYADTCNVYALRDGDRAVLIDLGSGEALDHLAELDVAAVEGIWLTHAHRDQCQGAARAAELGMPLHVPAAAKAFVDAELRDDFQRLSPCCMAYPSKFHPPQPMPEARFDVNPGQVLVFGPYDLAVHAAPGHLDHQVAYRVAGHDGELLFCGDAFHSRGKLHESYCLEHDHYTGAGTRLAAATLCALRNLRAETVCPSHGPVTTEAVWDAFDETIDRLYRLADLRDTNCPRRPAARRLARWHVDEFQPISDHLWVWNNSYYLVSEDGPVLMVDVQTKLPESFYERFHEVFGEQPIERVLVTHLHYDHYVGIEALRERMPLECWAGPGLHGLEHPFEAARPWLVPDRIHVDRWLRDGETATWREYELTGWAFPGQTDLHCAYSVTVDGHRALFSGDNYYPPQQWGGTGGLCGFNGGSPAGWKRSAELVLRLEPDWILASHMQPYEYRRGDFEAVVEWSERVAALMTDLAPDGDADRHNNPHYLHASPYVQRAGETNPVKLVLPRNATERPIHYHVTARTPADVRVRAGETHTALLAPGEQAGLGFLFETEPDLAGMRLITFDVTVDGERWGEAVECYLRGRGSYVGES